MERIIKEETPKLKFQMDSHPPRRMGICFILLLHPFRNFAQGLQRVDSNVSSLHGVEFLGLKPTEGTGDKFPHGSQLRREFLL